MPLACHHTLVTQQVSEANPLPPPPALQLTARTTAPLILKCTNAGVNILTEIALRTFQVQVRDAGRLAGRMGGADPRQLLLRPFFGRFFSASFLRGFFRSAFVS